MNLIKRLEKSIYFWFLFSISSIFFLLRLPSLFEPYWYGDEGIYDALGIAIRHGALLYKDIWDNKPPLLYLLYAAFNSNQDMIRFFSLLTGIISILLFFFLAKKLFTKNFPIFVSTSIFAILFGLPIIEGNIANAENFIIPLNLAAAILILKFASEKRRLFYLTSSGILLSLAFLFKIIAVFDFAAFLSFLLIISVPEKIDLSLIKNGLIQLKNFIPFIVAFIVPIFLFGLYFLVNHALKDFMTASFSSNVGYVSYGNKLLIAQGFLILKILLLIFFLLLIFLKKKDLKYNSTIFILVWFGFSLFNAYFSGRPYTHYLLALLIPFSLMIGLLLWNKRQFKIIATFLIISFIVSVNSFWIYTKIIPYYGNFISFVSGQKTVDQYRNYFDKKTLRDYDLAGYLKTHMNNNDQVYLWGNNAQVYKLIDKAPIERYTVAYHVLSYEDGKIKVENALKNVKPKYIVIMNDVPIPPFSLRGYNAVINLQGALIYERVI